MTESLARATRPERMDYEIRPLEGIEEYRACVALQEDTWGAGFSERVPTAILKVAQILGGVASGAWSPTNQLLGFVFGMTGIRDGEIVHWSDMLAVRASARGQGIGRALKLHQRQLLLESGVRTMLWTFDPLRAQNAYLNFTRLGVVAHEYRRDMYGQTDSPLHAGIGTDRLVAIWALDSPRVERRLSAPPPAVVLEPGDERVLEAWGDEEAPPRPARPRLGLEASRLHLEVVDDLDRIMTEQPELAREWRQATRTGFEHYLARGWQVVDFVRGRAPTYLLERTTDSELSPSKPGETS